MDTRHFFHRYRKPILAVLLVLLASISFYFILLRNHAFLAAVERIGQILRPFLWGGGLAFVLTPLCRHLERLLLRCFDKLGMRKERSGKMAHLLSCFGAILLFLLVISVLLSVLIPQLYVSLSSVLVNLPLYALAAYKRIRPVLDALGVSSDLSAVDWMRTARDYAQQFSQSFMMGGMAEIAHNISSSLRAVFSLLTNLLVSVIVAFYCLNNRRIFALQGKKFAFALLPRRWAEEALYRAAYTGHAFSGYVTGRILDSAIMGCICALGCSLLHIRYTLLIAVIVGITNVIPFFGPFIGGIPSAVLVLLENPMQALYFVLFILLLQQFDGNILSPRILSGAVGVSGFWVLFSILFFGGLFGVPGMLLGTPLFAVFYSILRDVVNLRLAQRKLPVEAWRYREIHGQSIAPAQTQSKEEEV